VKRRILQRGTGPAKKPDRAGGCWLTVYRDRRSVAAGWKRCEASARRGRLTCGKHKNFEHEARDLEAALEELEEDESQMKEIEELEKRIAKRRRRFFLTRLRLFMKKGKS